MPKRRQEKEQWDIQRLNVLHTYGWKCIRCKARINKKTAHIDHIVSGKKGSNHFYNLRPLCIKCHESRKDFRHEGMRTKSLKEGRLPPNYRDLLWE